MRFSSRRRAASLRSVLRYREQWRDRGWHLHRGPAAGPRPRPETLGVRVNPAEMARLEQGAAGRGEPDRVITRSLRPWP